MSTPRRVTVTYADIRGMSGVELFSALAHAGLRRSQVDAALGAIVDPDGDPELALRGLRLLQAVALELELRRDLDDPPSWQDAQRWQVEADMRDERDPLEAERREYRVAASLATGLPPDAAEQLPVEDVDAFARARGLVPRG